MAYSFFIAILSILLCGCSENKNEHNSKKDIEFIYNLILENHPGPKNREDPQFLSSMNLAYEKAIKSNSDNAMIDFVKSFNDAHVFLEYNSDNQNKKSERNIGLIEINPLTICIEIETFCFSNKNKKQYKTILKQIKKIKRYQNIVFDLRKNTGGNSTFGNELNDALFGKQYCEHNRCLSYHKQYVDWRVSEGNINHLKTIHKKLKQKWIIETAINMEKSLKEGKHFYKDFSQEKCSNKKIPPQKTFKKVIVIIDENNVSAALDFIDDLKLQTKNLILVGKETKADRLYMDIRGEPLPSGRAKFYFPIKVYRNRPRKDNEAYIPNLPIHNVDQLTAAEIIQKVD